jgi:hypothetical protein
MDLLYSSITNQSVGAEFSFDVSSFAFWILE